MNVYGRQDTKGAYVSVIVNILKIYLEIKANHFGSGKESFDFVNVKDVAANMFTFKKIKIIFVLI